MGSSQTCEIASLRARVVKLIGATHTGCSILRASS